MSKSLNFDAEGKLVIDNAKKYQILNAIWTHPGSQAKLYVGGVQAAQDRKVLDRHNISAVVNCTSTMRNYFEQAKDIKYYRFNIAHWPRHVDGEAVKAEKPEGFKKLGEFVRPMFEFVMSALAAGESVLVHCLAGAHRAGTTGCLLLMMLEQLNKDAAIRKAKDLRSCIDPIGLLPMFLECFESARASHQDFADVTTFMANPGTGSTVIQC